MGQILCNRSCESIPVITLTMLFLTLSPAVRRGAFVSHCVGLKIQQTGMCSISERAVNEGSNS